MFYQQLKEKFMDVVEKQNLLESPVFITSRILQNEEALGNPTRKDYPLLKGKEFLIEAEFQNSKGQAYTDSPCELSTSLAEIIALPLTKVSQRALFIATLNAVMRYLNPELKTIHCHNDEPEDCALEMISALQKSRQAKIGLVGLQPALLEALSKNFGAESVSCVDRDEDFRGSIKFGVPITWGGEEETRQLFEKSDLVLATGSTVVNGSLPDLLQLSADSEAPIHFYGTSIIGTAKLMGLSHFCFRAT